jgi:hypothetical protein
MIALWLIYHYKLQNYDSGVASIFHMPTKDAQEDNLLSSANQVSVEDNLLASANQVSTENNLLVSATY